MSDDVVERPPVNLESLRWLGAKFREWEAPYKAVGDWHGLWLGASATLIERAVEELQAARAASAPRPAAEPLPDAPTPPGAVGTPAAGRGT